MHMPIYIPKQISNAFLDALSALRLISRRRNHAHHDSEDHSNSPPKLFVRLHVPLNFITAPLIADLFLIAISAIGRREVHDGTIGNSNTGISPYDVIVVFLCLGYIANSIEASGLIRFLVFHVLKLAGVGHRLFFYLYVCFFVLGIFIGNDPIMLLFLFYMTRVSTNIIHPRAWIHTQFAIANIATGILVSSNPTNLVLVGAFNIKFVNFTANMMVPVFVTAILLFPFLLYIVFAEESLIPASIKVHVLTPEEQAKKPVDINIPNARGVAEEKEKQEAKNSELGPVLISLESILNPFLDKGSALFGTTIMVSTISILLALNAVYLQSGGHPDYWVTLPAAFVMFSWDLAMGWLYRHERREISNMGRKEKERFRAEQERLEKKYMVGQAFPQLQDEEKGKAQPAQWILPEPNKQNDTLSVAQPMRTAVQTQGIGSSKDNITAEDEIKRVATNTCIISPCPEQQQVPSISALVLDVVPKETGILSNQVQPAVGIQRVLTNRGFNDRTSAKWPEPAPQQRRQASTLVSLFQDIYKWCQETFPTTTTALRHLPYPLIPFAFSMFVLVEGLVNNGWVPVFAHGWDQWATKTGTVGSICAMGLLAVMLSNFAGTNIGASILLSRIIQAWQEIHNKNGIPISDRMFWGTVYSMALGVNYGAFSITFSASLAGIMWRTVLKEQHIRVQRFEFARVNFPIIAFAIVIACTVLVGQVYIVRDDRPYTS